MVYRIVGPDLLTPHDLKMILGLSLKAIYRMAELHDLSYEVTVGGHRRFRRTEVEELVNDSPLESTLVRTRLHAERAQQLGAAGSDAGEDPRASGTVAVEQRPLAGEIAADGQTHPDGQVPDLDEPIRVEIRIVGPDLLTPHDLQMILGMSLKAIYRMADLHELSYEETDGGHRRFRRTEVETHVNYSPLESTMVRERIRAHESAAGEDPKASDTAAAEQERPSADDAPASGPSRSAGREDSDTAQAGSDGIAYLCELQVALAQCPDWKVAAEIGQEGRHPYLRVTRADRTVMVWVVMTTGGPRFFWRPHYSRWAVHPHRAAAALMDLLTAGSDAGELRKERL